MQPVPDPRPHEIRQACQRIREKGYCDKDGVHPPWGEKQYRARGPGKMHARTMEVSESEFEGAISEWSTAD